MSVPFAETEDTVQFDNITFAKAPGLFTPRILKSMRLGRYEMAELSLANRCLKPQDRVLDIGAGIGFLSAKLAQLSNVAAVLSVEANPMLIDTIRDTADRNGVASKARCLHGILAENIAEPVVDFYIRKNFWASSMEAEGRAYVDVAQVPVLGLNAVVAEFQPTLVICDIEGGELALLESLSPATIERIVIETHPGLYGPAGLARLFQALLNINFVLDIAAPRRGDVLTFQKLG